MKWASEVSATRASAATSSGFSYERSILSRARSMRRLAASTRTTHATLPAARVEPSSAGSVRRADRRRATPWRTLVDMNLDALWHDLECGAYREDLPLWRALAAEAGGPVLDVGAGTGRVTLDLAALGVAVVALDVEAALLEALAHRATGVSVETVAGDARQLAIGRRF